MFNAVLSIACFSLLLLSYRKDKQKTYKALAKAWKSFMGMLPLLLGILLFSSTVLAFVDNATISQWLGSDSGWLGLFFAGVVGSITLIPAFVAYPLAANLLSAGAGYAQITLFITSLMMVGIITMPLEAKYFGKKLTFLRNLLGLVYSIMLALLMGEIFS